jgi:hypothetical protein
MPTIDSDYDQRSKQMKAIVAQQKALGINPSILLLSEESLAALHFALSKRQKDGEQFIPQKDFIANAKRAHLKGADSWLEDMLIEMKKETKTEELSNAESAKKYLEDAQPLESRHLSGMMQSR